MVGHIDVDVLDRWLKLQSATCLVVHIHTESLTLLLPKTDVSLVEQLIVRRVLIIRMVFIL